jgi:chromosome partitioning protein
MTQTLAVYSEAGGATKTTTAVSIAVEAARAGLSVTLIDLDPRGATTKWCRIEPVEPGLHVGAILAAEDPTGWAEDMAVASPWAPTLRVIPSSREVSLREKESADHAEMRLKMSLDGISSDLVVLDSPNRQGGPLILNMLTAADTVVYAGKLDEDGLDGVDGAVTTINKFKRARAQLGVPDTLTVGGIVVGAYEDTVTSRDSKSALTVLDDTYPGQVLRPLVPRRVMVREARAGGVYYGDYRKGIVVAEAYREIATQLVPAMRNTKENTK